MAGTGLRRFRESPTDLVIMNMYMPRGMGGAGVDRRVTDRLSDAQKSARCPVPRGRMSLSEALRVGANAMLLKPLGVGELWTAVAQCLLDRIG